MKCFILSLLFLGGCARPNYQGLAGVQQQNDERVFKLDFPQSDLSAILVFDQTPATGKANSFSMSFAAVNSQQVLLPQQNIAVMLWMPSMGHGSSPVHIEIEKSVFKITEVYFIMPGEWQLVIQLKNKQTGQIEEEVRQNISL